MSQSKSSIANTESCQISFTLHWDTKPFPGCTMGQNQDILFDERCYFQQQSVQLGLANTEYAVHFPVGGFEAIRTYLQRFGHDRFKNTHQFGPSSTDYRKKAADAARILRRFWFRDAYDGNPYEMPQALIDKYDAIGFDWMGDCILDLNGCLLHYVDRLWIGGINSFLAYDDLPAPPNVVHKFHHRDRPFAAVNHPLWDLILKIGILDFKKHQIKGFKIRETRRRLNIHVPESSIKPHTAGNTIDSVSNEEVEEIAEHPNWSMIVRFVHGLIGIRHELRLDDDYFDEEDFDHFDTMLSIHYRREVDPVYNASFLVE